MRGASLGLPPPLNEQKKAHAAARRHYQISGGATAGMRTYRPFADGSAQMAVDRQQRGDWVKSSLSCHLAIGFGPIAFDCRRAAPGIMFRPTHYKFHPISNWEVTCVTAFEQ
jgi:hypothetical protein